MFLLDENIIHVKFHDNCFLEVDDVKELIAAHHERFGDSVNMKRIIHSGKYTNISAPARKHLEKADIPVAVEAYVLKNLAQKMIFNIFNKLRHTTHPSRAFNDFESAKAWLDNYSLFE